MAEMRIVSLLPSATEIACDLGLADNLVAISHECDYPSSITHLPRITSSIIPEGLSPQQIDDAVVQAVQAGKALYQVDASVLQDLRPDLIITQGVCTVCAVSDENVGTALAMLPEVMQDCPIISLNGTNVAGIMRDVQQVGEAADNKAFADAFVTQWRSEWQALKQRGETGTKVAVLEWPEPPFSAGHWVPEMVSAAGGFEMLCQAGEVSQRLRWQDIQAADPDLLIVASCGYNLAKNRHFAEHLYQHETIGLQAKTPLRALQQGHLLAVDANSYFSCPSPRILRGAQMLSNFLHEGLTAEGALELVPKPVQ